MEQLTPEERSTITRYLAKPPRGPLDYLFASVTYLIPRFSSHSMALGKAISSPSVSRTWYC